MKHQRGYRNAPPTQPYKCPEVVMSARAPGMNAKVVEIAGNVCARRDSVADERPTKGVWRRYDV